MLVLLGQIVGDVGAVGPADTATGLPGIAPSGGYSRAMRAGAVLDLLHTRVARGSTADLPTLAPQITRALAALAP